MAWKSVKLIFNSVWIAEYSYILSKNGFEALNFWNFHSGSKQQAKINLVIRRAQDSQNLKVDPLRIENK